MQQGKKLKFFRLQNIIIIYSAAFVFVDKFQNLDTLIPAKSPPSFCQADVLIAYLSVLMDKLLPWYIGPLVPPPHCVSRRATENTLASFVSAPNWTCLKFYTVARVCLFLSAEEASPTRDAVNAVQSRYLPIDRAYQYSKNISQYKRSLIFGKIAFNVTIAGFFLDGITFALYRRQNVVNARKRERIFVVQIHKEIIKRIRGGFDNEKGIYRYKYSSAKKRDTPSASIEGTPLCFSKCALCRRLQMVRAKRKNSKWKAHTCVCVCAKQNRFVPRFFFALILDNFCGSVREIKMEK